LPDADDILSTMSSNASDNVGEVAEDWPETSKLADAELETFLKRWAERHVECRFWIADDHEEEIDAATTEANVATVAAEVSCTHCQKSEIISRHRNADTVPAEWFVIDEVGDTGGVFCSTRCVDAFRDEEENIQARIDDRRG
jgi:hypothetical protein